MKFTFYKKKSSGAYALSYKTVKGVTITEATIESISFSASSDIGNKSTSLISGQSYSWNYSVTPTKAKNETVNVSSTDESNLTASIASNGILTLDAKKEGKATITLTSAKDSTISVSKAFYVIDSQTDFNSFLTSNEFTLSFPTPYLYNYDLSLKFLANGTCQRDWKWETKDSDGNITITTSSDTFDWSISGGEFSFDNYSSTNKNWDDGRITMFLDKNGNVEGLGLTLECGDDFSTMTFKVKSGD